LRIGGQISASFIKRFVEASSTFIAPKIENYLAVILRPNVVGKFVVNSSYPIAPLRGEPLVKLAHFSNCGREMTTGGSNECIVMF